MNQYDTGQPPFDVYRYVVDYASEHKGNTPSRRQIAAACNLSHTTASRHVHALIKLGMLTQIDDEICIVRSEFTLANNAFDTGIDERVFPDLTSMKFIPKDLRGSTIDNIAHLGIVVNGAADEQFMHASYPQGWRYHPISLKNNIELLLLLDDDAQQRATARFDRSNYQAQLVIW